MGREASVTLRKLEPHSWAMAAGDKRRGSRYEVLVDGQRIGEVEKCSESIYGSDRTETEPRSGFRGYSLYWRSEDLVGDCVGYHHYTMGAAVKALLGSPGD